MIISDPAERVSNRTPHSEQAREPCDSAPQHATFCTAAFGVDYKFAFGNANCSNCQQIRCATQSPSRWIWQIALTCICPPYSDFDVLGDDAKAPNPATGPGTASDLVSHQQQRRCVSETHRTLQPYPRVQRMPSCGPSALFDGPKLGIFCHHNHIPGASQQTGAQNSDTPPKLVPFRKLGAPRQEEQKCHM